MTITLSPTSTPKPPQLHGNVATEVALRLVINPEGVLEALMDEDPENSFEVFKVELGLYLVLKDFSEADLQSNPDFFQRCFASLNHRFQKDLCRTAPAKNFWQNLA